MLLDKITGFAREYLRGCKSLFHRSSPVCKAFLRRWSPPARESWKINFDGAMFGESDEAGIGLIARNSKGEVKVALVEKIKKHHQWKLWSCWLHEELHFLLWNLVLTGLFLKGTRSR